MIMLHPRARLVNSARTDLNTVILAWLKSHDLTTAEEVMLLASVPTDIIAGAMRAVIKLEREDDANGTSTGLPTGS